ncbi:DNA repair protein RecN [Anaeromicropila herbilytica]|uniref:DNA repair protein RecN n=1 Tax=Anaeromicropila herbilytica TaxID=2785025 RepID=A0A7R7EKG2_9FIRM|nr:DNA repair protein RecN [Anaeromicropila herbilytica]BCN30418.1 DNA repair protein RecN [Anaeromicropila herbilytica]
MLLSLHVKNLAIINEVEVFFKDNLNILTGETGAGKSIIIGSINIALGGKINKDIIRKGADYALVELVFQIDDENTIEAMKAYDIPISDGQLIIQRKIMNNRSISKINGENVTSSILKGISSLIIDIHGQHEHQSLLLKNKHLSILDRYAKDEIVTLKKELNQKYRNYLEVKQKVEESTMDEDKKIREISFLEYEINEIENAKLKKEEDSILLQRYKKLSSANAIAEGLALVNGFTGYDNSNSAGDSIGRAVKALNKLENMDDDINNFIRQLLDIESYISDFNRDIESYQKSLSYEPEELREVEERLNLINNLKSKYGESIDNILEYCKAAHDKLEKLIDYDNYVNTLKLEQKQLEEELEELSNELSIIRKKKANILASKIKEALIDLNFLDVRFEMSFERLNHYTQNGFDDVEFMISTNPGEDIKPLSKVASGGELSRVMLAIKSVLADNDAINTLIFDEIDVGVSGRTAQKVSEKLSFIANSHQVLCITHLPQIAAMADSHYIIEKKTKNDSTSTSIRELSEDESIEEIARILGGAEITENVITNAREMKVLAAKTKKF